MDNQEYSQPTANTSDQIQPTDPYSNLSDSERKQVILTQQARSATNFIGIVIRGIAKIFEEVSSAILKR